MRVNVTRVWEDADYAQFRAMCNNQHGWQEVYNKKDIKIWTQSTDDSNFQMIKASARYTDVPASVAFDVIMDSNYRSKWDKYMSAQKDIGLLNPNNDITYYALYSTPPIRSRDFVMQRSWLDLGDEMLICSHSVCHEDFAPNKAYIRGTVIISGYLIRALKEGGCHITYLSHSDPKGKLPTWLVNRVSKVVAPKMIKKLYKACVAYPAWKKNNQPFWTPWRCPEQQVDMPRVDIAKCQPKEYNQEIIDESGLKGQVGAEDEED